MLKIMKRATAMVLACLMAAGMLTGFGPGEGLALTAEAYTLKTVAPNAPIYEKYEAPENTWIPLTDLEKHSASNEEAHFADVRVGNWYARSGKLKDSIRFCVSNKKTYKNTHYINYMLNGNYTQMTGLVSFCDKSEKFAEARVKIYLDNELAYESITLSDLSSDEDFALDVEDVKIVRIVCCTTKKASAFCVVAASVY